MSCHVDMTLWVGQTGISFTPTLKDDQCSSSFEISALERIEKNLFLNFEHYDLAIHMMDGSKI